MFLIFILAFMILALILSIALWPKSPAKDVHQHAAHCEACAALIEAKRIKAAARAQR